MRLSKLGSSRGARATLAHIRRLGLSIPEFAERHGIARMRLQNALRGDVQTIGIDLAYAIERATKGTVKAHWWIVR